MFQKIAIPRKTTEFQVKPEIRIEHIFWLVIFESLPHPGKCFLDRAEIGSALCNDARGQALESAAQLKHLQHIFFAQFDNACATPRLFRDESILGEQIDGLADRSLSDAELARPRAFHNTSAWAKPSTGNFLAKAIGHCVLNQRLCGVLD